MKTVSACQNCRATKRRCRKSDDGGSCLDCLRRDLECSLTILQRNRRSRLKPLKQATDLDTSPCVVAQELLPLTTRVELAEYYLHFIHDRPHSLFHRPSLQAAIRDGTIRDDLLLAICAIGSRFSQDSRVRELEQRMISVSRRLFHENLEDVCLESIQTCILLANICAYELKTSSEALYFGIAVRMAQIMDLPMGVATDSAKVCEIKRRIWWTIYMADTWCSSGLGLPRQINHSGHDICLPIDEAAFHTPEFDYAIDTSHHSQGLWAYMILLAKIFGMIQDLNRQLVTEDTTESVVDAQVSYLQSQLEDWEASLPQHMKFSEHALEQHMAKGLGGPFVALHLGHHHYCTLLFFNYLDIRRSTSPQAVEHAARCRHHAKSYARLLKMSREKGQCEAVYATVGHMAVVSSSVLLYSLLFGGEEEIDEARAGLVANFEALTELKRYWPSLDKAVSRLFTFQNACLWSVDANTHKVDRWMVRFLFEYALPLDEKHLMPVNTPDLTFDSFLFDGVEHETLIERHRLTNDVLGLL